jgi:hypothetical protein
MRFDASPQLARYAGKRAPELLPFAFRGLVPLGPDSDGWPLAIDAPDGMGMLAVRWWDELERKAANDP